MSVFDAASALGGEVWVSAGTYRERILLRGSEVVAYRWGRGERAVLLLHGWQGRASQFAPLVRELVAEGFRVTSFDAPAHGASGGQGKGQPPVLTLDEQDFERY